MTSTASRTGELSRDANAWCYGVFSQHIFPRGPRAVLCAGAGLLPTYDSQLMRPALPAPYTNTCRECQGPCDAQPTIFLVRFLMQYPLFLAYSSMGVLGWVYRVCLLRIIFLLITFPSSTVTCIRGFQPVRILHSKIASAKLPVLVRGEGKVKTFSCQKYAGIKQNKLLSQNHRTHQMAN